MRLTCPNCGARYEVDEAMIPPEGRDVQCSNCTTTWFQPGVRQGVAEAEAATPPPEPPVAHRENTRPLEDPEVAPEAQPRRELDPEVRDVLREEAERETALRREEGSSLETQEEMPLDAPSEEDTALGATVSGLMAEVDEIGELDDAPREKSQSEAAARYGGEEAAVEAEIAAAAATGAGAAASRRDLLPDIEEINSTLRATDDRGVGDPGASDIRTVEERPRRRSGTRLGFGLAVLIFAGLVAVYANAPRITAAIPQVEPALQGYVSQVDRLRSWIDEIAQGALTADDPASEEASSTPAASPEPTAAEPTAATEDQPAPPSDDETAEDDPEAEGEQTQTDGN